MLSSACTPIALLLLLLSRFAVCSKALPVRDGLTVGSRSLNSAGGPLRKYTQSRVPGVWRITKYASLLGPTIAILLYDRLNHMYEKYEPFVTTKVKETLSNLTNEFSRGSNGSISLHSVPEMRESPYTLKVANEVIRLVNRRLREMAVISRIQIDEDHYELKRMVRGPELTLIAEEVLGDVFNTGSGKFLDESEKKVVQRLVLRSLG